MTVNYRITETRPDGRYIDPDQYAGVREYTFSYHAESTDACNFGHESEPWSDIALYLHISTQRRVDGTNHTEGASTDAKRRPLL